MKKYLLSFCGIILLFSAKANILNVPATFPTIQIGIDSAYNGDTVLVQPGTYFQNINYGGKNIVVASLYLTTGDTNYISSTIITSSFVPTVDGSVVTFENNETAAAQLIGFTITAGSGNLRSFGAAWVFYGGGIFCNQASPVLSHLIITSNTAGCGGGIFLYSSNALVENCLIKDHTLYSFISESPDAGGAIACWNCSNAIIRNNKIIDNTVSTGGAGIYSLLSTVSVVNCLIANNHSMSMGSAFYADSWSKLKIINSTVYGNTCEYGAGGMTYCIDSAHVFINNSIFWNNKPTTIVAQFNYSRNEVTVANSDFEGGVDSIITSNGGNNVTVNYLSGNINTYPIFVDSSLTDLHLQNASPCINAGDTTGLANIPIVDLDSNVRFVGPIDMGCYENTVMTGIVIQGSSNHLIFYPNPTTSFATISGIGAPAEITVYNVLGKIISVEQIVTDKIEIDLSKETSGLYFITIKTDKGTVTKQIIRQ